MPIEASVGTLDVENATLRASGLVATTNLAVGRPALKDLNPPTLEIFSEGVPSLELHSNTLNLANSSNAFARFTASAETLVIQSGTDTANDSKGDIAFSGVNDVTRYMTIKGSTGRVGIGTDDPARPLEIAANGGNAILNLKRTDNGTGQGGIGFVNMYSNVCASITAVRSGTEGGELRFFTVPDDTTQTSNNPYLINERMRIDKDGNVGIGTTNPECLLHLSSATGTSSIVPTKLKIHTTSGGSGWNTSNPWGLIEFDTDDASYAGSGPVAGIGVRTEDTYGGNHSLCFYTDNNDGNDTALGSANERMCIDHDGNIGIGKSNPDTLFDFTGGTASFSSTNDGRLHIWGVESGYGNEIMLLQTTIDGRAWNSAYPYARETLCLQPYAGQVGIGRTNPSYTLDINGTIRYTSAGSSASDDRIKYNEENISNALTLVSQLNPQKYEKIMEIPDNSEGTWIPTDEEWENVKENYKYGDEFGLIAQDVRDIPELTFLVHGEETKLVRKRLTPEEYSNLSVEQQNTYTFSYIYKSTTITPEEFSSLNPDERELYSEAYTKEVETQEPLSVNYQGLFVVAIAAIKELKAKNDALEARILAIENA